MSYENHYRKSINYPTVHTDINHIHLVNFGGLKSVNDWANRDCKDEYLCRYLAEKTAARTGKVTVCTGGFHTDHITEGQIREVMDAMEEILASL